LFFYYFIDLPLWGSWAHGGLCVGDDDHMNHKKIGSSQFYFIFASRVFMVIAVNYYNCMIQIPKGFFFCTNGDLCGGGGCH
jgi:hypothetical protein